MAEVRLPDLAATASSVKVAAWLKRVGEAVSAGEPIVEIETDKTTVEVSAPAAGVLTQIFLEVGDTVAADARLATIGDAAEPRGPEPAPSHAAAAGAHESRPLRIDGGGPPETPSPRTPSREFADDGIPATPLARRMAAHAQIDLRDIDSDRPGGLITKAEIDRALGRGRPRAFAPEPMTVLAADPRDASNRHTSDALSPARRLTAARLQEAKRTIPHFYLQANCGVDALLRTRERVNGTTGPDQARLTITDLVIFAAARALRRHGALNACWAGEGIRRFEAVDVAVAVDTPKGLLTPILRGAEARGLLQISRELKALAERARGGTLRPDEYAGGTFTISNLGMFNVSSITPIINPPHAGILGVGAIETVPVVRDGALAVGRTMMLTLAADHRVVDGAEAARFLGELRRLLEDPMALALEV